MADKKKKVAKIPFKKAGPVKFTSFTFGATIPTQSFGNVQPHITVEALNYEDAAAFALPKIEALYEKYCEVRPEFMGRITVTEKVVTAAVPKEDKKESPTSMEVVTPSKQESTQTAPAPSKSPSVEKAEKAIGLAMSEDAVNVIQDQIEKSVKIDKEDKPALFTLCLKKKKELAANF